jgi:hypothetical protein
MKAAVMPSNLESEVSGLSDQQGTGSIEEDLFSLNAMAPDLLEHVPALFEETVRGSLNHTLGTRESGAVLAHLSASELASRQAVFARLASLYGEEASSLQKMIDRAFAIRVQDLLRLFV